MRGDLDPAHAGLQAREAVDALEARVGSDLDALGPALAVVDAERVDGAVDRDDAALELPGRGAGRSGGDGGDDQQEWCGDACDLHIRSLPSRGPSARQSQVKSRQRM